MIKLSSEKYTILLIILIFIIPLIALDSSFYFITKIIDFDSAQKKQEKEAIHEAESLAIEGNFSNEFSIYFRDFFDILQKTANIKNVTDNFLINRLETASNKIFEEPFPKSNLYVFRIPINKQQAELIYYNGSLKSGKRALCKTFEQLYSLNNENKNEPKIQIDSLTKTLLGKYTDIKAIAQEMRGITTNTNGIHKNSWFIWDYTKVDGKGIFGVIIFCDEIKDFAKYGRLLALKKLKTRGKAIGAFIPIYKEYGEAVIQPPLDKSRKFNNWIKKLTIEEEKDLDKWLINS
ncbi:MAG: hypothetical protein J6Z11_10715 [Candidatus Riflebacteria bacterium]|nr:hypothetical protein [Candidatus Riflebacteria bacterium]